MSSPEIVESALTKCSVDAMTVICHDHSSTNLRWASNTLTTNGVMRSRDVTVIAVAAGGAGVASANAWTGAGRGGALTTANSDSAPTSSVNQKAERRTIESSLARTW